MGKKQHTRWSKYQYQATKARYSIAKKISQIKRTTPTAMDTQPHVNKVKAKMGKTILHTFNNVASEAVSLIDTIPMQPLKACMAIYNIINTITRTLFPPAIIRNGRI